MTTPQESMPNGGASGAALWFGLLGGAAAWGVQFLAGYLISESVCVRLADAGLGGVTVAVLLVSLVTFAAAVAATLAGRRVWRRAEGAARPGGTAWAGLAGMLLSGVFAFFILVQATPVLLGGGCA